MEPIVESGMVFGPFFEGCCFHIEKSEFYRRLNRGRGGVKVAELILHKEGDSGKPVVWIVEAKSSVPRKTNEESFGSYISEVSEKLANSLQLVISGRVGRHGDTVFVRGDKICDIDLSGIAFRFLLIIKGCEKSALSDVKYKLLQSLRRVALIWNLGADPIVVMNDAMAISRGFVTGVE